VQITYVTWRNLRPHVTELVQLQLFVDLTNIKILVIKFTLEWFYI